MSELYELPDGWEWIAFRYIFDTLSSKPYQVQKSEYLENGILPIIDQGKKFIVGYSNTIDKKYLNNSTCIIFGDHTRQIKYIDFNFVIGADGTKILKEKKSNLYDLKFLYFQLLSKKIKSLGYSRHFKLVKKMSFAIPPLQEQKRIVSKLDTLFQMIDKAIALHQKNMNEANAFMGSVLNEVFGELENKYGKISILSVMKINNQIIVPSNDEIYNYIGLENIESNSGKLVDYTPSIGKDIKSSKVYFKKGMVLYGKLRPYLNKVWIADFDGIATTEILPFFSIDNSLNMEYVKYYFLSPKYLAKVMDNCSGARMPRLTTKFIKSNEAYMPVPYSIVQQKTVTYLDKISLHVQNLKQVQKEKMQSLVALKASILDQAFRGKL